MQSQQTHKKETFSAKHVKSPNLAFGQYFANKLADVRRLWRQGFRGGALIRMCCSYCVFLSALSSVLPKTYKPGLQGRSVRQHEIKQCFKTVQNYKSWTQQQLLHHSDWRLMFFPHVNMIHSNLLLPTFTSTNQSGSHGRKKKKNWDTLRERMVRWQLFNHEICRVMVGLITAEIDPRKTEAD